MKVIGSVTPKFLDDNRAENSEYFGGQIVMLTSREATILKLLQAANDGALGNWSSHYDANYTPDDKPMDKAFWLIYQYVIARFALNDFGDAINGLENRLRKLAETPMDND